VRMCEHEERDVWIRTGEREDKARTRGRHNVRIQGNDNDTKL